MATIGKGVDFSVAPLLKALENTSTELKSRADAIAEKYARAAAAEMKAAIPVGPPKRGKYAGRPHLRETIKVTRPGYLIWRTAVRGPHAHLWERGTVSRSHRRTGKGVGRMPAANRLIPIAMSQRRRMENEFARAIPNKELV